MFQRKKWESADVEIDCRVGLLSDKTFCNDEVAAGREGRRRRKTNKFKKIRMTNGDA